MSSQSRARCPLCRQVTQICLNLQVPGKAHLPLFHELQICSSVSGRTARLMDWEAACPYVPGGWIGCKDARAHWACEWSGSRHNLHVRVAPEWREMIVAACRLAFSSFVCCWRNHLSYSIQPRPLWSCASLLSKRA